MKPLSRHGREVGNSAHSGKRVAVCSPGFPGGSTPPGFALLGRLCPSPRGQNDVTLAICCKMSWPTADGGMKLLVLWLRVDQAKLARATSLSMTLRLRPASSACPFKNGPFPPGRSACQGLRHRFGGLYPRCQRPGGRRTHPRLAAGSRPARRRPPPVGTRGRLGSVDFDMAKDIS